MPGRRIVQLAVSVALLLCAVLSVLWVSEPKAVAAAWSGLFASSVVLVVLLLLGGVVLSSLRLQLITADLGYRLTFRDAAVTLSVGQLAGTAFFQFAGQLIGRGVVLTRKGIPPAATVVISSYERTVALSVSLLLAGCGALYLFGSVSLNLETGGLSLVKLALGVIAAIGAGAAFVWGRAIVDRIRKLTWELFFRLVRSFAISLAIQGTTLAAYVALESTLAPQIGIASLAAASCIIMLAASLPISFGGWGLRELSAVVALQAIGLSSASALLIALLIGLLSLAVIAGMAVVVLVGWEPGARPPATTFKAATPDYTSALDWLLPLMAATAVLFQIYVPTGNGKISVNLADPVVILGASLFVLHGIAGNWPAWRVAGMPLWVAAASTVILISLLHGWVAFGWTDWAFVNKGLGWPMLLCYGATGALIVRRAQHRGLEWLLMTFAVTGAAIASIEIGLTALARMGSAVADGLVEPRAAGLSQNPNAFAFMLILMLAATLVLQVRQSGRIALMVAALVGIWFTGSRAGVIAVPAVMGAALAIGIAFRPLLIALLASAVLIVSIAVLPLIVGSQAVTFFEVLERTNVVNAQHLQTIYDGLAMFWAHPLFGAGLGAYMEAQLRAGGAPLVIHSTAVWLLAETGIVGFAVFAAAAWRLFADAVRHRGEAAGALLLLVLCGMAVMSSAHEMLYQRAFWLLLGAALAMPAAVTSRAAQPDAAGARVAASGSAPQSSAGLA